MREYSLKLQILTEFQKNWSPMPDTSWMAVISEKKCVYNLGYVTFSVTSEKQKFWCLYSCGVNSRHGNVRLGIILKYRVCVFTTMNKNNHRKALYYENYW